MKRVSKILLTVALSLVLVGALLVLLAFLMVGFDPMKLNNATPKIETYILTEAFQDIDIDVSESNIVILASENGECRVVSNETEKVTHTVTVEEGILKIRVKDRRAWYEHIGLFFAKMELRVYLPQDVLQNVKLKSISGRIHSAQPMTCNTFFAESTSGGITLEQIKADHAVRVGTVSGDIAVRGLSADVLEASSTSGNLSLKSVKVQDGVTANTVSGEITWTNGECADLNLRSTSGDLKLDNCIANGKMTLATTSGNLQLLKSDAQSLALSSVSGNVSGELLTGKDFTTKTTSGNISVPRDGDGGKCSVSTVSGNIKIRIA